MENETLDYDQIATLIRSLSVAWREKQFDRVAAFFSETVVFQDTEGHRLAEGKTACIQSYRDFMENAAVLSYNEESPDVVRTSGIAIANYRWRIDYQMNAASFHDEGRDWLALEKQDGDWRIIWRLISVSKGDTITP